jgi:hypothetical protein
MDIKKFLTADEVATEFGLNADALQKLVDEGQVQALADRGTWKYRRDELQALVDSGKIALSGGTLQVHDPDDVSYIELDEEALDEQATMIKKSSPADEPVEDWFVPSEESEMKDPSAAAPALASDSDSDVEIAADSDSDVKIAPAYDGPKAEDSGILLDFNLDAGATVSSGSSLRLPHSVPGAVEDAAASSEAEAAWDDVSKAAGDSAVHLGGDSTVRGASDIRLPTEESGIVLDEGSHVGMTGGSSVLGSMGKPLPGDSDLVMDDDSGLVMGDSGLVVEEDSGTTLEDDKPDSGITLDSGKPDSGIALGGVDSGISLGGVDSGIMLAGDSGISLEGDSGLAIASNARTVADDDRGSRRRDNDRTQTLDLADESNDDSAFDINLDDADATRELHLDDDDADETSATVVRKGRPPQGALSAAFELDEPAEVEDLEISHDLDADVEETIETLEEEEEEVFDASDEAFSGDEVEAADEDEDYLEAAEEETRKKKATGPREPAWGMGMTIGLVCCTLFLVANSLILWTGVSTMWDGADSEGPTGTLVQTFGDIIPK